MTPCAERMRELVRTITWPRSVAVTRALRAEGFTDAQIRRARERVAISNGPNSHMPLRLRPMRSTRPAPIVTVAPEPEPVEAESGGDDTIANARRVAGLCVRCARKLANPAADLCFICKGKVQR